MAFGKLRWGILGTGNIARQFSAGVNASRRGVLSAVASRSRESAVAFAQANRIQSAVGYDELLSNPNVDAIYISLPNSLHHEWTIKAVRAGKHVLCEKPFAVNLAQSQEMFDESQKAGRVLMEAFMYRSHPLTLAYEKAINDGAIGELKLIRTSFCYRTNKIAGNIRFDPSLSGGGLMDVGCYCLNFARHFARAEPTSVTCEAHLHESGVDDLVAGTLKFSNGVIATFTCGMRVQADNTAYLSGSEGFIEVPVPWKPPATGAAYSVVRSTPPRMDNALSALPSTPPRETFTIDAGGDLYGVEADDFAAAILDGTPPRISKADTLGNMQVLDTLRRQIGIAV